jgi:acetylxylan esterase
VTIDRSVLRRRRLVALLAALVVPVAAASLALGARPAAAASMAQVTSFGSNPTNMKMYWYVPNTVAPRPGLLVLMHFCTGSASAVYNDLGRDFVAAADRYGFIIVLPEVGRDGRCFDVSSPQALRRNGGSDNTGIMSMVSYVRQRYTVDPERIAVAGFSSGAMMTNVMAAQYPDVFTAAAAFSGVPATCFATTNGSLWNSQCSGGQLVKTPQQWGDAARAMYPGYTGRYPRMQLWHGTTDTTLSYVNFGEAVKQWTNLRGVSQSPTATDYPFASTTRTRYGDGGTHASVEGLSFAGYGHSLPLSGRFGLAVTFLGLDGSGTVPSSPPVSRSPSSPVSRSPSSSPGTACRVEETVSAWSTGLTASVTITNTGATALDSWALAFTLPAGQSIVSGWNATYSPAGGRVTARNVAYNGSLAPGGSTTIGFQAEHTGNAGPATAFTLNGTAC